MNRITLPWLVTILLTGVPAVHPEEAAPNESLRAARSHYQHGRYPDALRHYRSLADSEAHRWQIAGAMGASRVLESQGEWDLAAKTIAEALQQHAESADLWGRQAELQFRTGQYDAARGSVEQALKLHNEHLAARLIQAHLDRESGQWEEAVNGYRWFVRYYNRKQPRDAESLLFVAEGSLEYARWKRVSSIFHFVVNTLCPDALQADPEYWQASRLSGELLLEKYNLSQAVAEFEAAKKINPRAVEIHASLARAALQQQKPNQARLHLIEALACNPRSVEALALLSRLELEDDDVDLALMAANKALKINPRDQQALACQGACFLFQDGIPNLARLRQLLTPWTAKEASREQRGKAGRFETLLRQLAEQNPAPGLFLTQIGEFLESRRKFDQAELFYRTAIEVMPQLSAPRTALGMLAMRTGHLEEARKILDEAFDADPFHVRISNMRKVLDVIDGYETIRTDHFLIRVAPSDRILGEMMAEYLEEVHAELTRYYDYEPPSRTQLEIFSDAQGQSAHQWFSARMVGLPWIQTIGASTGLIVAMASPSAFDKPFHWGRVLKHEYVHILTLQQTDFNIPHWYTEALAVRTEGVVMPESWKRLLKARVPTGELFSLKTIQNGFRRPEGPDDWTMAYCQSRLYADFLERKYGADSLLELLHCYQRGLSTPAAISQVCGVSIQDFEKQYRSFLEELVQELEHSEIDPHIAVEPARAAYLEDQKNADNAGRYAYALFSADKFSQAMTIAEQARGQDPREPFASAVLARIALEENDADKALAILRDAHRADAPSAVVLGLLAEQYLSRENLKRADELYALGTRVFPSENGFWKGRAVALLKMDRTMEARQVLAELARRDADNASYRRKLARLAYDAEDYASAARWAREILFVEPEDVDAHITRGLAAAHLGQLELARREFGFATRINPRHEDLPKLEALISSPPKKP